LSREKGQCHGLKASSSVATMPGPASRLRIGNVNSPGCGVRIASQSEPESSGVALDPARAQAAGHVVEAFGFRRPDTQARRLGFERQRDAGRQTAATAADHYIGAGYALFRCLFGDLQTAGALAGNDQRLVKRLDQGQAALAAGRAVISSRFSVARRREPLLRRGPLCCRSSSSAHPTA
jgi:hypothetical protein